MNSDDVFQCPKCRSALKIPAWLWVKREQRKSGGYSITISSDDTPSRNTLACPSCGHEIPIEDITKPRKAKGWLSEIADLLGIGVGILVIVLLILLVKSWFH